MSTFRFLGEEVRKAAFALVNLTEGVNYWDADAEYARRVGVSLDFAAGLLYFPLSLHTLPFHTSSRKRE